NPFKSALDGNVFHRLDHQARQTLGAVDLRHRDAESAEHVWGDISTPGGLHDPIPTFGWKLGGIGAVEGDATAHRHRIAGVLIDQTKLEIRIALQQFVVMFEMSPGKIEIP